MRTKRVFLLGLLASAIVASAAGAHPAQHGPLDGHLVGKGAWGKLSLVSKLNVTNVNDLVADLAVSPDGKWVFLANWGRETCDANSEAGGQNSPDAGAWVVDISDPANPKQAGFIPHSQDSRPGEGMQVVTITTKFFNGQMLVMNNEQCGKNGRGGVSLFDVTNPRKPAKLSEHFGDRGFADTNDIHSAFAWDTGDNAYVVMTDNFEATDVDILDITNPSRPRLIAEYNLNRHFGSRLDQPPLLVDTGLHDMVVKKIGGRFVMLLSYWDAGYVAIDVTNPTSISLLGHTEYANPDPELLESTGGAVALPSEGNGHQAEFTADNRFFIGTDEDFAPYRGDLQIVTGPNAGSRSFASEFGWVPPIANLPDGKLNGPTVYGGYGCPGGDAARIPDPSVLGAVAPGEERILVLQRGPVSDPAANFEACFFSEKVEQAQLKGYDAVLVANHHSGASGGFNADLPCAGSQGHDFDERIPGMCIAHKAFHELFGSAPRYDVPYAAGTEPTIGSIGAKVLVEPEFDGWGYVHLYDANTFAELDTYAVDEAHDANFAFGYGDLSVHEVATHPTNPKLAFLAYYSAGMRALKIEDDELVEIGGYLDPQGNDFWGVETFVGSDGVTYVAGSDRDSGLVLLKYTGRN